MDEKDLGLTSEELASLTPDEITSAINALKRERVLENKQKILDSWNQRGPEVFGYKIPTDSISGLARMVGEGATFGYFDEASAAIDSLLGRGNYDDLVAMGEAQRKAYKEKNPYVGSGIELASSVALNPLNKLKLAGLAAGGVGKTALAGLQGAGEGALYASGTTGQGEEMGDNVARGALFGGVLGSASQGISGLMKSAPREADKLKLSSYGIGVRELKKPIENMSKNAIEEGQNVPILNIINKAEDSGLIKASLSPRENIESVIASQKEIGKEIGATLEALSEKLPAKASFKSTTVGDYLTSLKGSGTAFNDAKDYALKQKALILNQFENGGTLADLQKSKTSLNYAYYKPGEGYKIEIDKALRGDLQRTIEERLAQGASKGLIPDGSKELIKGLNKEWGEHETLIDTFIRQMPKDEVDDLVKKVNTMKNTTGGLGSGLISTMASGNPIPLASQVALEAAKFPGVRRGVGSAFETIGKVGEKKIGGEEISDLFEYSSVPGRIGGFLASGDDNTSPEMEAIDLSAELGLSNGGNSEATYLGNISLDDELGRLFDEYQKKN